MKITNDLDDEFSKAISIYTAITFLYNYDEKANDELKGSAIKYILTNGNGTCYHKTMLFLILAKAAGLDARFVLVKEDMYGNKYPPNKQHACAGVVFSQPRTYYPRLILWIFLILLIASFIINVELFIEINKKTYNKKQKKKR